MSGLENPALAEWLNRTAWAQHDKGLKRTEYLGLHLADAMRMEIFRLRKELESRSLPPSSNKARPLNESQAEYLEWCRTFYQPEALDEKGAHSLHSWWAWIACKERISQGHVKLLTEPMSTAPKDGTYILAMIKHADSPSIVCWADPKGIRCELRPKAAGWHIAWDGYPVPDLVSWAKVQM